MDNADIVLSSLLTSSVSCISLWSPTTYVYDLAMINVKLNRIDSMALNKLELK